MANGSPTLSMELGAAHGPFSTLHRNTFAPSDSPLTTVPGLVASTNTPVPLINVHSPVPGGIRALPAKVALVMGVHTLWSGPASAVSMPALYTDIETCALFNGKAQGPFITVHWNTFTPYPMSVMVVVGLLGDVIVPLPLNTVHSPVAGDTGVVPVTVTSFAEVGTQMLWSALTVIAGCVLE